MTKRIKRISSLQLGKLLAVMYGLFSLIVIPFLWIATFQRGQTPLNIFGTGLTLE
jgi:hypothetical protein